MEEYLQYVLDKIKPILVFYKIKYETNITQLNWIDIITERPLRIDVSDTITEHINYDDLTKDWVLNVGYDNMSGKYRNIIFNSRIKDSLDKYQLYTRREGLKSLL